jgi:hypothetical protein
MQIKFKHGRGKNPLVVVVFTEDSNFNPDDLTWTPRKDELKKIYNAMKKARAWD